MGVGEDGRQHHAPPEGQLNGRRAIHPTSRGTRMENRRDFLKMLALAAAAAAHHPRPNEKVRWVSSGPAPAGAWWPGSSERMPTATFVAACDVRQTRVDQALAEIGGDVKGYRDYRHVLDRQDIDAVLVTSPDHWHGPMVAAACAAGKDVYVEKPLTHTIEDALAAVEAARAAQANRAAGRAAAQRRPFPGGGGLIQDGLSGRSATRADPARELRAGDGAYRSAARRISIGRCSRGLRRGILSRPAGCGGAASTITAAG